ncbi:Spy/CpxP family protein refolding chaperone [Duganella sp. S19_KUP01_CR8]|uniref:Spy/CpxP family protein refolding chaperone n=1 Tax=Duganella sp. S19_KUP01_CR8 TaxID=3025502 RepID=UPI002FCD913B
MKTPKNSLHNILLAAAVGLPLFAAGGAARADDAGHPPMMKQGAEHDGPEHGAGDRAPGPGFHHGRPPFVHGIELSEAQEDKVFAILHAQEPYLRDQDKAAAKAHEALRAMGRGDQYDDAKAAALARDAATAMANIALQHVRTEQKLLAVLTAEQRKQQAESQTRRMPRP